MESLDYFLKTFKSILSKVDDFNQKNKNGFDVIDFINEKIKIVAVKDALFGLIGGLLFLILEFFTFTDRSNAVNSVDGKNCAKCKSINATKTCGKCRQVFYCSRDCHWKSDHRIKCGESNKGSDREKIRSEPKKADNPQKENDS